MSDTSILPTADVAAPAPPAGPDWGDEPGDDRRRLMIIGGAIAGVLVLVLGYLLLHGGGGSSEDTLAAVPRGTPHTVTSPAPATNGGSTSNSGSKSGTAAGGSKAGDLLPKKSNRGLAKDPFKPLVADSTGTATTGTPTDVNGSTAAPGTVPTSPAEGGAPSGSLGPPLAIRLVDVLGESQAVFDVTYSHHQVFRFVVAAPAPGSARGTVFAQDFALLGLQNKAATVQVGDDTPFDMKKGTSRAV